MIRVLGKELSMTYLPLLITGICLCLNGITDLIKRDSYTYTYLVAYVILFIVTKNPWLFIGFFLTAFVSQDTKTVGGGDVDASLLIFFTIGINGLVWTLIVACVVGLIYSVITKDKKIPLITMMCIGYLVALFLFRYI